MATKDDTVFQNGVLSIPPAAAITADITTGATSADLAGYESCTVVVSTGVLTTADAKIYMVDSADNSTFAPVLLADIISGTQAAVSDATLLGSTVTAGVGCTLAATDDNKVFTFGYRGSKRYVKAQVDVTTTNGFFNVVIMRGTPRNAPVS